MTMDRSKDPSWNISELEWIELEYINYDLNSYKSVGCNSSPLPDSYHHMLLKYEGHHRNASDLVVPNAFSVS